MLDLFIVNGVPDYIRSDNVPEFSAVLVRKWLDKIKVNTLFIEPGSPWENGYKIRSMANSEMNCLTEKLFIR